MHILYVSLCINLYTAYLQILKAQYNSIRQLDKNILNLKNKLTNSYILCRYLNLTHVRQEIQYTFSVIVHLIKACCLLFQCIPKLTSVSSGC